MKKAFWFAAGGAVGALAVIRARRAAEAFTYDGIHDRLSGLFLGARIFTDQVRQGAHEKEGELRARLDPDYIEAQQREAQQLDGGHP